MQMYPDLHTESLLDFGCGIGRFATFLNSRFGGWHGADILNRLEADIPADRFELIEDGRIPFGDKKFDLIWTCVVLQHVVEEPELLGYLQQFADRLSSGGRVLMIENTSQNRNKVYLTYRSLAEYQRMFDQAGLSLVRSEVYVIGGEEHSIAEFRPSVKTGEDKDREKEET